MGRLFWIALGATAGVLVVRKLTQTAQAYTPAGVASSIEGLGDAVREGMDTRETELRVALGIDSGAIDAETARQLIENPSSPRQ